MLKSRFTWLAVSAIACTVFFSFLIAAHAGQGTAFTSQYTDLKRDCRAAIKLKKGEEYGGDMPLKCKGYGGYEINIGYSATSSQFSINRLGSNNILD